jgi:hypothetical protein
MRRSLEKGLRGSVLALLTGCGASSYVTAPHAEYPVSMSSGIRDADGSILPESRKERVGTFTLAYLSCSMAWRLVSFTGERDVSEDVNQQVKAAAGDAITDLRVESGATVWSVMTLVGLLPDCGHVRLRGAIVRVNQADRSERRMPGAETPTNEMTVAPRDQGERR